MEYDQSFTARFLSNECSAMTVADLKHTVQVNALYSIPSGKSENVTCACAAFELYNNE